MRELHSLTPLARQRSAERGGLPLPRASRPLWSIAVLLAAMLAFLCQSLVTQSHVHIANAASAAPAIHALNTSTRTAATPSGMDEPACAICQEVAQAGVYLPAPVIAFDAPAPAEHWREITWVLALALRQRSHAWQSRAPPHSLQA